MDSYQNDITRITEIFQKICNFKIIEQLGLMHTQAVKNVMNMHMQKNCMRLQVQLTCRLLATRSGRKILSDHND